MNPVFLTFPSGIAASGGGALGAAILTVIASALAPRLAAYPVCRFRPQVRAKSRGGDSSYWEDDGIFRKPVSSGGLVCMAGEVWTALSAVAVAILGPVVAYKIKRRQDADAAQVFKQGLEDTNALMASLSAFSSYGSPRSILWAGHNGGGLPAGGSPFYTTAIHAHIAPGHPNLIGSYSKLLVDAPYVQMLIESIEHIGKAVVVTTSKMKPSMLRDFYEAEAITSSLIIGLGIKDAKFYYISLGRYEGDFDKREVTLCELQARQVWSALTGGKDAK